MKSIVAFAFALAVIVALAGGCSGERERPSPAPGTAPGPDARALKDGLVRQGFACGDATTERNGVACRGHVTGYPLPIRIYAPGDFRARAPFGLAYHFHGWRIGPSTEPFLPAHGDFGAYLVRARRNAVLIVPESAGRDATYAHALDEPAKVRTLLERVEAALARAGVVAETTTPRAVSGHSGAYLVVARLGEWAAGGEVPELASVRGVALLDAAYGYRTGLREWEHVLHRHSGSVYWLAFNPDDGSEGKRETYLRLGTELRKGSAPEGLQVVQVADPSTSHMDFVPRYLPEFLARALPGRDAPIR